MSLWPVITAIRKFLHLNDTPASYSGQAGKYVKVSAAEDALEFSAIVQAFLGLTDTPASYSEQAGKYVKVNEAEDSLEFGVVEPPPLAGGIILNIDGEGAAIPTGIVCDLRIPFNCTIKSWHIFADQTGSIVIDVWKDTYANFPPTVADTITGSEKPTLSSAVKNQDIDLATWTPALVAGDILRFNVDSAATVQKIHLEIVIEKT